jgi:hypothetical protein
MEDKDILDLQRRLEILASEIQVTVQDGLKFISLLEEYQSKFLKIQTCLLTLKARINEGEYSKELEEELQRNLSAMAQLSGPSIRKFIQNRFELFKNFEKSARLESEAIAWEAFDSKLNEFSDLIQ